jgi:hypothetical protein
MQSLIGGAFPYKSGIKKLPFKNGNFILTTNARSAIHVLYKELKPNTIWLPSFICKSVFSAVSNVSFYEVSSDLKSFTVDAKKDDMVIVVNYFGFPYPKFSSDAIIVEDASQSFFSQTKSDFVVFSPNKFLGCPDGGILWAKNYDLSQIKLKSPPQDWIFLTREGRRRERRDWFEMTQLAKKASPVGFYKMHFEDCLCYEEKWKDQCVQNYNFLHQRLSEVSVMGELNDNTVPSGFPIVVEDRYGLRNWLFQNQIYPPIHWDISSFVPRKFSDSHNLSKRIMTIPCDYRYDICDMERIVNTIKFKGKYV